MGGLGFRVKGLGFRALRGLGFRAWGLGGKVGDIGLWGLGGFGALGSLGGSGALGFGVGACTAECLGFESLTISGLESRV